MITAIAIIILYICDTAYKILYYTYIYNNNNRSGVKDIAALSLIANKYCRTRMLSQDRVWHCVQLCGYLDTVSVAVHFARTDINALFLNATMYISRPFSDA